MILNLLKIFLDDKRFSPSGFCIWFLDQFIEKMEFNEQCPIILMNDWDERTIKENLEVIKMKLVKLPIFKVMVAGL